jgi:23S rRNA (pseudouridine1915-N3)-methyltransferase
VVIHLVTVGKRPPDWVEQGYQDFARRLPQQCALQTVRVGRVHHGTAMSRERILQEEGERMLSAIPAGAHVVALQVEGESWTTEQLAARLDSWLREGHRHLALLIGGPEGLASTCRTRAADSWSLSSLTLPHSLVRVVVAEQIYRAWSLLNNHPYHRAG